VGKIFVLLFVIVLVAVSFWMFRYQYFDKEMDGLKYTTRRHIITEEECYFVGEFKRSEIKRLGLVHCAEDHLMGADQ
jgi:hypothetical protein